MQFLFWKFVTITVKIIGAVWRYGIKIEKLNGLQERIWKKRFRFCKPFTIRFGLSIWIRGAFPDNFPLLFLFFWDWDLSNKKKIDVEFIFLERFGGLNLTKKNTPRKTHVITILVITGNTGKTSPVSRFPFPSSNLDYNRLHCVRYLLSM